MTNPTNLSRRSILAGGAAASLCWAFSPRVAALLANDPGINLVLLELNGGNDGLSTVVPYTDDLYHAARTTTRHEASTVLPLDDRRGLHPNLGGMRALWERGELAVVEGVGYPEPNRSHFMSREIWGTASPLGTVYGDGWISRVLTALHGEDKLATRTAHVGGEVPESLASSHHPVLSMASPASYRWIGDADTLAAASPVDSDATMMGGRAPSLRSRLRATLHDARASSDQVRGAVAAHKPRAEYPDTELASAMYVCAAMLRGGLGSRILSVSLEGLDTHGSQRDTHDRLMAELDGALSSFLADVRGTPEGRKTVVLVYTEFGRRVEENASAGTDHGAATACFLAGEPVQGGFYGETPSLADLDDSGDLKYSTDFRSLYATLIKGSFGLDPDAILPGHYEGLPLLRSV